MDNSQSPFLLVKGFAGQVNRVLSALDLFELPMNEQKLLNSLKQEVADARLDVRDYELSETRAEQVLKAADATRRLDLIRTQILAASEYNVFSAIDVAQLTAQLEQIIENVR